MRCFHKKRAVTLFCFDFLWIYINLYTILNYLF